MASESLIIGSQKSINTVSREEEEQSHVNQADENVNNSIEYTF